MNDNASSTLLPSGYHQQSIQNINPTHLQPYPTWLVVFLWLLTCVFCVETTLGNLLVLCAYKLERNIRKHLSNKFIVSLAVSDLIIGMEGFPLLTVYVVERERWPLGRIMCQMWLCVDYTLCLVSILTVLLITVDRYCSVCYPASYRVWQTRQKIHAMIVLSWLVPFGLFALMIFGWDSMTTHVEQDGKLSNETDKTLAAAAAAAADLHKCSAPFLNDPYVNMSMYIAYYWTTLAAMSVLYRGIHKAAKTLEMKSKAREKQTLALILGQRCMAQVGVGILMQTDQQQPKDRNNRSSKSEYEMEEEESLFHRDVRESETIEECEEEQLQATSSASPSPAPLSTDDTTRVLYFAPGKKLSAGRTFSTRLLNSSRQLFKTPPPTKRQIKSYCSLDLCDSGSLCSGGSGSKRRTASFRKALSVTCDGHRVTRQISTTDNKYCYNNCNKNYGACVSSSLLGGGSSNKSKNQQISSSTKMLLVSRVDDIDDNARRLSSSSTTPEAMNRYLDLIGDHKRRLSENFNVLDNSSKSINVNDNNKTTDAKLNTNVNNPFFGNDHRLYKESLHSVLRRDTIGGRDEEKEIKNREEDEEEEEEEEEEDEESAPSVEDLETEIPDLNSERQSSKGCAVENRETFTKEKRNWLTTLFTHPTWLLTKKRRVSKAEKRARKAFRTITVIVGTFALFWSPYFIVATVYGFCPDCVPTPLFFTSYYLCYLNSSVNPFAYAFANRLFRKTFVRILRGDFRRK